MLPGKHGNAQQRLLATVGMVRLTCTLRWPSVASIGRGWSSRHTIATPAVTPGPPRVRATKSFTGRSAYDPRVAGTALAVTYATSSLISGEAMKPRALTPTGFTVRTAAGVLTCADAPWRRTSARIRHSPSLSTVDDRHHSAPRGARGTSPRGRTARLSRCRQSAGQRRARTRAMQNGKLNPSLWTPRDPAAHYRSDQNQTDSHSTVQDSAASDIPGRFNSSRAELHLEPGQPRNVTTESTPARASPMFARAGAHRWTRAAHLSALHRGASRIRPCAAQPPQSARTPPAPPAPGQLRRGQADGAITTSLALSRPRKP